VGHALVVGAGLAGLAAAHRLQAFGQRVTVLEARARAGGKHALAELAGESYEAWPGVLPRSAPAFAELVAELGVANSLHRESLQRFRVLRDGRLAARSARVGDYSTPLLRPLRARRLALVVSWLGAELDAERAAGSARLDDRSAADFCRVYLGRRALDELVAPLFATHFGIDAQSTSRELLLGALDAGGELLLDLLAGAGELARVLARNLQDLRTGTRVAKVAADGRSALTDSGETLGADAVVLAVGSGEAARLVREVTVAEAAALASLASVSAISLAVATKRDLELDTRVLCVPAREGGELAGAVARSPRLLQLVARPSLAARHGHRPDDELAHALLESAERALPGLSSDSAARRVHRFPDGRPAFAVGHYRALARLRELCTGSDSRRVALAGDWSAAPNVAGELASGLRAARAVRKLVAS
jgi:oxygen-dependent protoporphyrinogen oxidase